jgi:hypothetical protein
LKAISPAVMDQLKSLGFEVSVSRAKEKAVIGKVPLEKLTELAKLETIKFVAFASH